MHGAGSTREFPRSLVLHGRLAVGPQVCSWISRIKEICYASLKVQPPGGTWMFRNSALVLALALGSLNVSGQAFAQLTPPAGSAGAGNTPISGVSFGPANPRVLSDPSGIGNASAVPPLRTNSPAYTTLPPPTLPPRSRVAAPPYAGATQRLTSAHAIEPKSKSPSRRRPRPQVSTFTGICRGC